MELDSGVTNTFNLILKSTETHFVTDYSSCHCGRIPSHSGDPQE